MEQLTLAGYSWGGLLALLYAIEHPDRVGRLALVSPAPAWREARLEFERRFSERNLAPELQRQRAELRESGLRERDPADYAQRLFELSVAAYFHDPARARDLTPFRVTGRTQQEVWASLGDYDLRPRPRSASPSQPSCSTASSDPIPIDTARTLAELLKAEFHASAPLRPCAVRRGVRGVCELLDGFLPLVASVWS